MVVDLPTQILASLIVPSKFASFISSGKVLGTSLVFIKTKGMKLYPRSPLAIRRRAVSVSLEIRGEEHNEERKTTGA